MKFLSSDLFSPKQRLGLSFLGQEKKSAQEERRKHATRREDYWKRAFFFDSFFTWPFSSSSFTADSWTTNKKNSLKNFYHNFQFFLTTTHTLTASNFYLISFSFTSPHSVWWVSVCFFFINVGWRGGDVVIFPLKHREERKKKKKNIIKQPN
jgi:hypothetical protein